MTLGDRHLSDPPGGLYNPYCLSPSYHDPTAMDPFHVDPATKPPSSPMSIHDHSRHLHHHSSGMLQSQPQMHHNERPHTVHGAPSELLRYIDPCNSPYDQLFPFTDDVSHPSMRGSSPVDHPTARGVSPSERISASHGTNASAMVNHFAHQQAQVYGAGGPQRTGSDTSLPSALDAPLDMAFLDIPGGSPTHNTPPWTPMSSHAFHDNDDPLMQPLPQLDGPSHNLVDISFPAQPVGDPRDAPSHPQPRRPSPQLQQPQQNGQQSFRGATAPLPRAASNAGSMSGLREDSVVHRRTHSPALSDAGMPSVAYADAGRTTSGHLSGHMSEPRSISHLHGMPQRSGLDEATAMSSMHVQDAFGSAFNIQPPDPPRAEVSGMSREKSLRLLHNSITGQPTEAGVRGSFQPVSLNTYSSWGMQPGVDNSAVPARRISGAHATSGGGTPHAAMQHADVYTSAGQPPQTSGGHGDMFSASVPKESDVGSARGAVRMDGPPRWQHSGGSAGPGGGGAAAPVDGRYAVRQGAGMPQQVPVGGGYGGPQVIYGVPAQANNSFNAMYIGMQPAYLDHNGGVAGGPQGMSIFPQEQMLQVRGGPMAAPQAMPGANGHAVHEGTQRGGTALRRLQNVPEGSTRPVMLRAAPTGRTAPRRSGVAAGSQEGRTKRSAAMTLSEMVAKADAVTGPAADASRLADSSLHSSSKRTRTSNGTALHPSTAAGDTPSVAGSQSASMHTNLTGAMEAFGVSEGGGGSTHGRSRRSRLGLDPKDEWTLEDWVTRIAREEAAAGDANEVALREEFLDWETRSKSAPNGKWRGANSRKWGKVGIEMRLTGSVPRTEGPVTQLGRMVCKFVDVVEAEGGPGAPSPARPLATSGGQNVTVHVTDASTQDEKQVSGHSGQESAVGGMNAIMEDTLSMQHPPGALDVGHSLADVPHWRSGGRSSSTMHRNSSLRASGRSFSAMQAMEGDEKYVWRLAEIVDKQAGGVKTVLKEKVWLGTYHTPINAAVHHDFYKVVLAVEGCIFTSVDVPTCSAPTGKKKSQKLKLNFPLNDLPELMYKAVRFTQLWNKYKQDAERYVFRSFDAAAVRALVQELIDKHCLELRKHVANNDPEGTANTVERRSTRTRATIGSQRSVEMSGDIALE